jgi:hypothetical protein
MKEKTEKKCTRCNEILPIETFNKDAQKKDGYRPWCRPCQAKYHKNRKAELIAAGVKRFTPQREDKACPYKKDTLQYDVWVHFYRFKVRLDEGQMDMVLAKLNQADNFWAEMDKLEEELTNKQEYKVDFLEFLREGREMDNYTRTPHLGGENDFVRVRQLSLEGEYIATYDCIADASFAISGSRTKMVGGIANTASGLNRMAGGFIWEYDC